MPRVQCDVVVKGPQFPVQAPPHFLRIAPGQYGNLVLSRLPILRHTSHVLQNRGEMSARPALRTERRGLLAVVLEASSGPFAVLTSHWSLDAGDWRPVVAEMKRELDSSIAREKTKPLSVAA